MKKTNRQIPIYPRVTLAHRNFLAKTSKKFKKSESEIIDTLLSFGRTQPKAFTKLFSAKT